MPRTVRDRAQLEPAPRPGRRRHWQASRHRAVRRDRWRLRRAADPDLERFRGHGSDARPVDLLSREQPPNRVEAGLEARRTTAERHAQGPELVGTAADRGLHHEAPPGDRRQRADLLRQQHRVPERQQEERARGVVAPLREQAADNRDVLVVDARRGGVVVAHEQRVEPGAVRRSGPLDHPARARPRLRDISAPHRHPDSHSGHSTRSSDSHETLRFVDDDRRRTPPRGRERRRFRRRPPAEGTSGARLRGWRPQKTPQTAQAVRACGRLMKSSTSVTTRGFVFRSEWPRHAVSVLCAPGSSALAGGKMAGSHGDHHAANRVGRSACTFAESRSRSDDPGTISRHETSTAHPTAQIVPWFTPASDANASTFGAAEMLDVVPRGDRAHRVCDDVDLPRTGAREQRVDLGINLFRNVDVGSATVVAHRVDRVCRIARREEPFLHRVPACTRAVEPVHEQHRVARRACRNTAGRNDCEQRAQHERRDQTTHRRETLATSERPRRSG